MLARILPIVLIAISTAFAQKYNGPVPAKPDLPYLKHAENLVPTEATDVKEEKKKDDVTYVIPGASSSAKTPLASPIFLLQCEKLVADKLGLYKMDVKNGRREVTASPKKPLKPLRVVVSRLTGNLYRIEVDESLEAGEYALSPEGANTAFCFQVF